MVHSEKRHGGICRGESIAKVIVLENGGGERIDCDMFFFVSPMLQCVITAISCAVWHNMAQYGAIWRNILRNIMRNIIAHFQEKSLFYIDRLKSLNVRKSLVLI